MPLPSTMLYNPGPISLDELLWRRHFGDQDNGLTADNKMSDLPPLAPEEEDSLLGSIGKKALGGIGYVGGLLDKYTGGRAMRGLLGGKPQELLSLIPGSDKLGITNEDNAVSGRDLTDQIGLTGKGDDGILSTVAGIGADILTNPTSYLSFGTHALTNVGKVAQKIGALPGSTSARIKGFSSLADIPAASLSQAADLGINPATLINQPLGGVARAHLPFSSGGSVLGTGQGGLGFLDTLGQVGSTLAHNRLSPIKYAYEPLARIAAPVARYGNALFNHKVAGATTEVGQQAGRAFTSGVASELQAARGVEGNLIRQAQGADILDQPGLIRGVGEQAVGSASPIGVQGRAANSIVGQAQGYLSDLDAEGGQLGFLPRDLEDVIDASGTKLGYLPRHSVLPPKSTPGYGGGLGSRLPTDPTALLGREEFLKGLPGGTEGLNALSMDPELSGTFGRYAPLGQVKGGTAPTTALQRAQTIRERYLGVTPAEEAGLSATQAKIATEKATLDQVKKAYASGHATSADVQAAEAAYRSAVSPAEELLAKRAAQSHELEHWASSLDPAYVNQKIPLFGHHPIEDFMTTASAKIRRNEAGKAIHSLFAENAVPSAMAGPGSVPVSQALAQAGFDDTASAALHFMGKTGAANMGDMYLPKEVVNDAIRFLQPFQTPAVLRPLVGAIDYVTKLTKGFQTAIWPGFHSRNFVSGQFSNFMLGAGDPRYGAANPMHWAQPIMDAQQVLRGGVVAGAKDIPVIARLGVATDEEATKALANLAYQTGAVQHGAGTVNEVLNPAQQAAKLKSTIPGLAPYEGFGKNLSEALPRSLQEANPLNVAGVGSNEDLFAPIRAGRKFGENVENTNRLSAFIGQLRQGFSPEEAALRTRAAHVDYSALSPFERNVMRRVIPFYTYTRGITPFVLDSLLHNPGGLAGQYAMAAHDLRMGQKGFVPEYMGTGLALPTGKEEDGTQRFLTRIDTPVEAAFSALQGGGLDQSLMGILGQTNPLIKGPLEYATGKQFFTGRDLPELYSMTGSTGLDQLLMNSPLSRALTTGRQLMDPRKLEHPAALATNLLTGARLSDVNVEKERELAAKEFIKDNLQGHQGIGHYETLYARPGALPSLSPQEIELLRLSRAMEAAQQKRAQEAKRLGLTPQQYQTMGLR